MRAVPAALAASCSLFIACQADLVTPVTESAESEVMGGTNAPPGKWPDVAAVMFNGEPQCTGTLIAPTVVLTAGHCNDATLNSVLVGTHTLSQPGLGETLDVKSRFEYPFSQSSYDVTVLVLKTASTKTPRPIASGWAQFDIKNGAQVAIVGYGAIDRDATQFVNQLQEATTSITDANCTAHPGCNSGAKPNGELGAGGMGIDTCPGDSGGPLYTITPYGTFLAGVTSRAYDDAQYPCIDGGIYVRPDKIVDWIELKAGVPIARGPEPKADKLTVGRGQFAETQIVPNDPKPTDHTYTIKQAPRYSTATLDATGKVRVCTTVDPAVQADALIVTVADAAEPARAVDVRVDITLQAGAPGTCNDKPMPEPEPEPEPEQPGATDPGGCCDSGRSASGSLPLALAVGVILIGRRRRRS